MCVVCSTIHVKWHKKVSTRIKSKSKVMWTSNEILFLLFGSSGPFIQPYDYFESEG